MINNPLTTASPTATTTSKGRSPRSSALAPTLAPENVLQQLVDALQTQEAQGRRLDKKTCPSIFKGNPGVNQIPIYLKPMIGLRTIESQNVKNPVILDTYWMMLLKNGPMLLSYQSVLMPCRQCSVVVSP